MNADEPRATRTAPRATYAHVELTRRVIGVFFDVYNELGRGFLEVVYQRALALALEDAGIGFVREPPSTVYFRGRAIGLFHPDFLIESVLIVEIKALRELDGAHQAQLLNYLRASKFELGLLLNFGARPIVRRLALTACRDSHLRPSALICGPRSTPPLD